MNRLFTSTALAAALAVTPALAQQYGDQPQGTEPLLKQQETAPQPETAPQGSDTILEKQPQDQAPQDQAAERQPMEPEAVEFVTAQQESDWLASSLIGRAVYNTEQQSLGSINDVILDQEGQVMAVLIGVGGFLGIGGKDVGVNFASLQFEEQKDVEPAPSPQPGPGLSTAPPAGTESPAVPGQAPGSLAGNEPQSAEAEDDADHSKMIIVLNVTKEELSGAPAFMKIGEEPAPEASSPPAQSPEPSPSQTQ